MSNIINVKEQRNVLSYVGDVFDIVAKSSNFHLKFELDDEWKSCQVITVVFNANGKNYYAELDDDYMCQIPPVDAAKINFCITAEPGSDAKLSSTILSLDVRESGDTSLGDSLAYNEIHGKILGIVEDLRTGYGLRASKADTATLADTATFAVTAGTSQTQVSLTGDETIAGTKNFTGTISHNGVIVPDVNQVGNDNLIVNGNFIMYNAAKSSYSRTGEDTFCADHWALLQHNGKFKTTKKTLTGSDESGPVILCQWVEDSLRLLYGKTITVSAKINGVVYYKTLTLPATFTEDTIYNIHTTDNFGFRLYVDRFYMRVGVQFLVVNGVTITIEDVKLEVSAIRTRYVERPTALEAAMCLRFAQDLRIHSIGFCNAESSISFFVNYGSTLKYVKSFLLTSILTVYTLDGESFTTSQIVLDSCFSNGARFHIYYPEAVLNKLYFITGSYIKVQGDAL